MKFPDADGTGQRRLLGQLDRIEEVLCDISSAANEPQGHTLLRGRVKRLEESVSDIHEAQATMEQSLRVLSLASLKIKRALADVVVDLGDFTTVPEP